jgi:hypothetical protein
MPPLWASAFTRASTRPAVACGTPLSLISSDAFAHKWVTDGTGSSRRPLTSRVTLRAFDALLTRPEVTVAVEAITRLRDAQAQLRAAALKQRDGHVPRLVLLIKATQHNRTALASAADVLATTFPLGTRATLAALEAGVDPGDNGIVLL